MTYIMIGTIVGIVMGLTGAGGALVAIPLFMHFLDVSLKNATILSLIAVILGTSFNLAGRIKRVNLKTVLPLSILGMFSNYISLPLKSVTPDIVIAVLLTILGFYSIWSVWKNGDQKEQTKEISGKFLKLTLVGIFLGIITTITGLGGGVILVPLLITFFGLSYDEALPTSLATVFTISLTSFGLQSGQVIKVISPGEITLIALGTLISVFMLNFLKNKINPLKLLQIRRIVFTLVTVYSVTGVLIWI